MKQMILTRVYEANGKKYTTSYKTKCDKCSARLGALDRKKQFYRIIAYTDAVTGKQEARCIKHL